MVSGILQTDCSPQKHLKSISNRAEREATPRNHFSGLVKWKSTTGPFCTITDVDQLNTKPTKLTEHNSNVLALYSEGFRQSLQADASIRVVNIVHWPWLLPSTPFLIRYWLSSNDLTLYTLSYWGILRVNCKQQYCAKWVHVPVEHKTEFSTKLLWLPKLCKQQNFICIQERVT
jgi:hypothetical protein